MPNAGQSSLGASGTTQRDGRQPVLCSYVGSRYVSAAYLVV